MNPIVRQFVERKHLARQLRLDTIASNDEYEDFLMEPESSKTFGFPDNSYLDQYDSLIE
jgi:hypothetical protein